MSEAMKDKKVLLVDDDQDILTSMQAAFEPTGAVIETANYVVFNVQDLLRRYENLSPRPSKVAGYGYWGKPSSNAVTPYEKLVFGVFIIEKSTRSDKPIESELNFPLDLFTAPLPGSPVVPTGLPGSGAVNHPRS